MKTIRHAGDLARWRLCLGCGACAPLCPQQKIRLVDVLDEGIRPHVRDDACGSCRLCLEVCPAWENDHSALRHRVGAIPELLPLCGPVLELWEGHAGDPVIRHRGASGGVLTALALFALEQSWVEGVLQIGPDPDSPARNRTAFSRSRDELLACAGSRYAPASVCDSLPRLEQALAPCVFIGQPSEVTALRKAQQLRPALRDKVAVALSFFCAGSPSRAGTLRLLASLGLAERDVAALRYRGHGWPGAFTVTPAQPGRVERALSYAQSWSLLQAHRPFSTHLCPDGTGEDADISCGDPWYREPDGEAGSSLVLVRTETGRRFLHHAMESGYLTLRPAAPWKLLRSQRNLFAKRGAVGGRIAALRLLGLPAPRLAGFALAWNWSALPLREQARSFFGTFRRVFARGYRRPLPEAAGLPVRPCVDLASPASSP